jgi:DNA-binding CsgD family transcriptional regulator
MLLKDIQEDLVRLFLRLNGYFTTGLIIHSPDLGNNKSELDIIGIRFPFHLQEDRVISCSPFLQIPNNTIDIIIGEVKSGEQRLQFNSALREDRETINKLIDWIGAFAPIEKARIIEEVRAGVTPQIRNSPENFIEIRATNSIGTISIRPIIFSVDRPRPSKNQPRFVHGQLILDYIWECLRPENIRPTCSTIYDLQMWGHTLMPIVEYFKDQRKTTVGTIEDFYSYFGFDGAKQIQFSSQQRQIIQLICEQNSVEEIALQLNFSADEIEKEQNEIQNRIGSKSEVGIVIYAIKNEIFKI